MSLDPQTKEFIENCVRADQVVLFMKGDRSFPQCGFSARVVEILEDAGASFKTFDVLSDERLRQGLKVFSNWPTFPQLYVRGELVGGHDIIVSMHQNGELQSTLGATKQPA